MISTMGGVPGAFTLVSGALLMLDRIDNKELRDKILSITYSEWKKLGFSKGTLHQLKEKAKSDKPFYLQKRLKEKLELM